MSTPRTRHSSAIREAVSTDSKTDRRRNVLLCRLRGLLRRGLAIYISRSDTNGTVVTRKRKDAFRFGALHKAPVYRIHVPREEHPSSWLFGYDWIPIGPRRYPAQKRCGPVGTEYPMYHFEPV